MQMLNTAKLGEINSFLTIACVSLPSTTENEKKKAKHGPLLKRKFFNGVGINESNLELLLPPTFPSILLYPVNSPIEIPVVLGGLLGK